MVIFLYGPDSYRRLQKKKGILAEFLEKHSPLGIGYFDLAEADSFWHFRTFSESQSIFESTKIAVLDHVFETDPEELIPELKSAARKKELIILIASEEEKPKKPLDFLIKEHSGISSEKFDYFKGVEWRKFVQEEAKKQKVNLSAEALSILALVYQNNTWGLITELEKISLLNRQLIKKEDLEYLEAELSPDFWQLITGLNAYTLANRLNALEKIFSVGEPAGKIFNILAYQKKEKEPFFAGYDLAVKSGKLDYEEALLALAIN